MSSVAVETELPVRPNAMAGEPLVRMDRVTKDFILGGAFLNQTVLRALSEVSFALYPGRALALVGESGSGKSTCARMISRVYGVSGGRVEFRGQDVSSLKGQALRTYRAEVQMVFQDPFGSLNGTHSIGYHIERPIKLHDRNLRKAEVNDRIEVLLTQVGLTPARDYISRRPHELSGGQRQRVAIARALSVEPKVLLADEPTSMLDVSVRLGILNLLEELKTERNLATLYITHDIATARYFAEDTAVLYAGHLVEQGPSEEITEHPQHPYTQLLIEAVPNPERKIVSGGARRATDIPLWTPEQTGCPFVSRCPRATAICRQTMPDPVQTSDRHVVRCHHL
jgi:peptide/nickel transport system ATP-binding protein